MDNCDIHMFSCGVVYYYNWDVFNCVVAIPVKSYILPVVWGLWMVLEEGMVEHEVCVRACMFVRVCERSNLFPVLLLTDAV